MKQNYVIYNPYTEKSSRLCSHADRPAVVVAASAPHFGFLCHIYTHTHTSTH